MEIAMDSTAQWVDTGIVLEPRVTSVKASSTKA